MSAGETYTSWDDRDNPYPSQQRMRSLAPIDRDPGRPRTEVISVSRREPDSWTNRTLRRRKDMPFWQEMLLLLGVAFFLAVLVRTFLFQAFYIPSSSMEGTLQVGDRVLVNKVVYDVRTPKRGEVVVFRGTSTWAPESIPDTNTGFFSKIGSSLGDLVGISQPSQQDFIKRIIGLPGDTVACCDVDGHVTVNGKPLIEPYVTMDAPLDAPRGTPPCGTRSFPPTLVAPGNMFVMGDHRLVSLDSRCQGQVPITNIIGRASAIVWPAGRWASLPIPSTFASVPKPYSLGAPGRVPVDQRTGGILAARNGSGPAGLDAVFAIPLLAAFSVTARSARSRRRRPRKLRA